MYKPLHTRNGIDGLNVSRKERARELANIEDSVNASKRKLGRHKKKLRRTNLLWPDTGHTA